MDDTHVIPVNDLMPHRETRDCWCCPRIEFWDEADITFTASGVKEPDAMVIHNALDMRELREKA